MSLVEFSELIVKKLVKEPDMIKVQEFNSDGETIIEIIVAEDDMGRVIGKKGKIANSIKTLIQAKAYNDGNKKVKVNIDSFQDYNQFFFFVKIDFISVLWYNMRAQKESVKKMDNQEITSHGISTRKRNYYMTILKNSKELLSSYVGEEQFNITRMHFKKNSIFAF